MSKIVMSLPDGMVKGVCAGAAVSLISYILLQFFTAFLISEELVSGEVLCFMVCMSAGLSSFMGCRVKKGAVLSAATVVAVFLVLTVVIGFLGSESGVNGDMLVRVGVAMSVGGLVAAALDGVRWGKGRRREKSGRRYR